MERRKYPIRVEDYELYEVVGDGASAAVHRALCVPFGEIVAIKILDFERIQGDLSNVSREAQTMALVDHPNLLNAHCSFVHDHNLWVVMPYMAGGSCFHIMKSAYPKGFEEVVIATVLREVLKGLDYLHIHGHIHRDVKAGNILVDAHGGVKLGDFGVSACLFDSGDRQRNRNTFVGTPCWMAPEVMEQKNGYDFKADIWSFGITALELAHGHAPFSSHSPMKVLLMTLQNAPPSLDNKSGKKFSKSFKQMIAMCLVKDPSKRPCAHKLLSKSFFKQARSQDYIARKVLEGLPPLDVRFQALKKKEEEFLAEKKMLYGEKEEISQNEYKRGISCWNFDIEDVKVSDNEDLSGKDQERCSKSLLKLEILHENTCLKDNGDAESCGTMQENSPLSSTDEMATCSSSGSDVSKNEPSVFHSSDILQNRLKDNLAPNGESVNQHNRPLNLRISNGFISPIATELHSETMPNASKSTVSDRDDHGEKPKTPVVQQKGRFKVTSGADDLDMALPTNALPRSYSSEDNVISLGKQQSFGRLIAEGPAIPMGTSTLNKNSPRACQDRKKELKRTIDDLQMRLALAQDELVKIEAGEVPNSPCGCNKHGCRT